MRNLKYKIILIELVFIILGCVIWMNFENKLIGFAAIVISTLLTDGAWFSYVNQQIKKKKLVLIKHPTDQGFKLTYILLSLLGLAVFFYILLNEDKSFTDPVLAPIYIGFINGLFSFKNCFFIDNSGIIQPETFKKNLIWEELNDFKIEKEKLSFEQAGTFHTFEISSENERIIRDLISNVA